MKFLKGIWAILFCCAFLILSAQEDNIKEKTTPLSIAQQATNDSLEYALNNLQEDSFKVKTLIDLHKLWRINHSDTAIFFADSAINLSQRIDYAAGAMEGYLLKGIIYYKTDKIKNALRCFIDAYPYAEKIKNYKKMLSLCNNISVIGLAQGNFNDALEYTVKMLEINKNYFDNSRHYQCNGNLNIAIIMKEQGKYRTALSFYKKALLVARDVKEKTFELKHGSILDGMGTIYHKLHILDSAKYCFKNAIDIRTNAEHDIGVATTTTNYAKVLIEEKNYKQALSQLNFALNLYKSRASNLQIAKTKLIIAEVKLEQKAYKSAINLVINSIKILESQESKGDLKQAYKLLANIYSSAADYKKAFIYEQMYSKLKDTIYNDNMAKELAQMRTTFELEKQEERIKHLKEKDKINKDKIAADAQASLYKTIFFFIFTAFVSIIFLVVYRQYQIKKKSNEILQKQKEEILARNVEINAQKEEILTQRDQLKLLNDDITASIRYAKKLQDVILPPENFIKSTFSNAFVVYTPKDIVSGDFYWVQEIDDKIIFAVVDCTGHGVPGAFMSIVGNDALQIAVEQNHDLDAGSILNHLNQEVSKKLHQSDDEHSVKDGMDIALGIIHKKTLELQFAGAYNPLYIVRDKHLQELKGDPFAIGMFVGEEARPFTNNTFQLEKGDMIYAFSDGYADQFGGPKGKKFKYKPFKQMLMDHSAKSAEEQKLVLEKQLDNWMQWPERPIEEKIDDICILGIRV